MLATTDDWHEHQAITLCQNGLTVGMHAIDQHDAEVLWRQLQISDDGPDLGAWRIFTIFPLESSGPKEADQLDVNLHSL